MKFKDAKQRTSSEPNSADPASCVWTVVAVSDPKGGVDRREFRRSHGYTLDRFEHGMTVRHEDRVVTVPWSNISCIVRDFDG